MTDSFIDDSIILTVLRYYNPWWQGVLPREHTYPKRPLFSILWEKTEDLSNSFPILLTGILGTGKTTLLRQTATQLLNSGVRADYILYIPVEHPVIRTAGLESAIRVWSQITPTGVKEKLYLLLDEIGYAPQWEAWIKRHQNPSLNCQIIATLSSHRTTDSDWLIIRCGPLSFREYLDRTVPQKDKLPENIPLKKLFSCNQSELEEISSSAQILSPLFNNYLSEGGLLLSSPSDTNSLNDRIQHDILNRILRGNIAFLHNIRNLHEIESLFLYLCLHAGQPVDLPHISKQLDIPKNSIRKYLELLESIHLLYRIPPFAYGKEVLRGKVKILLANSTLSLPLSGDRHAIFENRNFVLQTIEGCIYRHLFYRRPTGGPLFSYWQKGPKNMVNLIATGKNDQSRPFFIHYSDNKTQPEDLKALAEFCSAKEVPLAYVITKRGDDLGPITLPVPKRKIPAPSSRCMRVPACLFCYWMSYSV